MTRRELDKMGRDLRRAGRRDRLTALGYTVALFIGAPLYAVILWVILELASKP
jgi:zinc transporter ZupT